MSGSGAGRPKLGLPSVVYYLKLGNRVKIGTSTNLKARLKAVPYEILIAVEPGGNALERRRHAQFANLRRNGEWFEATQELLEFAVTVRQEHGEPVGVWNSLVERHARGALLDAGKLALG